MVTESRGQVQKSLNMIVEDYIPDAVKSPSVITVAGWKERYWIWRRRIQSAWSKYIVMPSQCKGYHRKRTAEECQELYRIINDAIPRNDKATIKTHTTNLMETMLRGQFEEAFASGHRIQWELKNVLEAPSIHYARAFAMTTQKNYWAQITIKMVTEQIVCIYDRKGKIVFGHPTEAKRVVEYPCFERNVSTEGTTWRLAAKLAVDDPRRVNGLVPQEAVVQAAMEGKSVEEQKKVLMTTRKQQAKEFEEQNAKYQQKRQQKQAKS